MSIRIQPDSPNECQATFQGQNLGISNIFPLVMNPPTSKINVPSRPIAVRSITEFKEPLRQISLITPKLTSIV